MRRDEGLTLATLGLTLQHWLVMMMAKLPSPDFLAYSLILGLCKGQHVLSLSYNLMQTFMNKNT